MTRAIPEAVLLLAGLAAALGAGGDGQEPTVSGGPPLSGLTVRSCCRAINVLLIDAQGRKAGSERLGTTFTTIPNSSYFADTSIADDVTGDEAPDAGSEIEVMGPAPGAYTLEVAGLAEGSYRVEVRAFDQRSSRDARGTIAGLAISRGDVHGYRLLYRGDPVPALTLRGGLLGGADISEDADSLLSFGYPAQSRLEVGWGLRSFGLVVVYDAEILPASFGADLNGADVTRLFRPAPGSAQKVEVPLQHGVNVLTLRVEGRAHGRMVRDTDQLTFKVPN